MGYYLASMMGAVYTRLNGDTGTGGLRNVASPLIEAVHVYRAPTNATLPYVTFNTSATNAEHEGFRTRVRSVTIDVHTWVQRAATGYNPLDRCDLIMARIIGDWPDQLSGTGPTFGLDRWQPTLTGTGWEASIFDFVEEFDASEEEDRFHFIQTLQLLVSDPGAVGV